MKISSENEAVRSLGIIQEKIHEYREQISKVLGDVEATHDDYELTTYKVYQALIACDNHLAMTERAINRKMNK
jgi:hypothetical protein